MSPFEPTFFPRGGAGGGGGGKVVSPVLITGWGSLFDPDSYVDTFSHTSGLLDFLMLGDTTIYDGFRENGPGVEVRVRDIPGFEAFTPQHWKLFIYDKFENTWQTVNDSYGAAIQITDDTLANRATANGTGFCVERRGTNFSRALTIGEATIGPGGTNNLDETVGGLYQVSWALDASNARMNEQSIYVDTVGDEVYGTSFGGRAMSLDPDDYYLAARIMHRSTTSGTPQVQRRVYMWATYEEYPT